MSAHVARRSAPRLSGASFIGHGVEYMRDPLPLLTRFNRECGDIGFVHMFGIPALIVNTPELVGELLVEKAASFRKSRVLRSALYPLAGDGLFTSEGELWRRQRKLMAPLFHPTHLRGYAPSMTDSAERCAATWKAGDVVEFHREATRITMAIASKTLFDTDTFDETDEIGEALTIALRWAADESASFNLGLQAELAASLDHAAERWPGRVGSAARSVALALDRPILWPGRRARELREAVHLLDLRVQRMIDERRASAQDTARNDLLSRLLSASQHHQGQTMSDRQIRDEVLTLFVAGHETTATALTWAFYYVGKDPPLQAALEAEALALDGIPTADDLPRLPLTQKVFKESLRIVPPVPVMERQALEPVEIGGQRLSPGRHVVVFPWALHHRESLWPEPDRFDPERFAPHAESARPRHSYVPFGAGPRVCIGNHFALLEGPLVLATLLRCARFELLTRDEVKPDPRAATLRPLGGIRMRVSPRG